MNKKVFLDTNIVADIIDSKRLNHDLSITFMEKLLNEIILLHC